jgi:peptidoglycan-associated lipoprotein
MIRQRRLVLLVAPIVISALVGCAKEAPKTAATASESQKPTAPSQESAPAPPPPAAPPPPSTDSASAPVATARPVPRPRVEDFVDHPALKDVLFDSASATIGRRGAAIMRDNAAWLVENRSYHVLVEGHTDSAGSTEGNLVIAERRAKVAAAFLVGAGVAESRVQTVSYGSDRPVCQEKSPACAAKNRRVHFRVKAQ